MYHALESQVELAKARSELEEAGLTKSSPAIAVPSTTTTSPRDIQDVMRQMRDIAEHEEH